jgi:hypothetical protein
VRRRGWTEHLHEHDCVLYHTIQEIIGSNRAGGVACQRHGCCHDQTLTISMVSFVSHQKMIQTPHRVCRSCGWGHAWPLPHPADLCHVHAGALAATATVATPSTTPQQQQSAMVLQAVLTTQPPMGAVLLGRLPLLLQAPPQQQAVQHQSATATVLPAMGTPHKAEVASSSTIAAVAVVLEAMPVVVQVPTQQLQQQRPQLRGMEPRWHGVATPTAIQEYPQGGMGGVGTSAVHSPLSCLQYTCHAMTRPTLTPLALRTCREEL